MLVIGYNWNVSNKTTRDEIARRSPKLMYTEGDITFLPPTARLYSAECATDHIALVCEVKSGS
jgi:hypothetical protein